MRIWPIFLLVLMGLILQPNLSCSQELTTGELEIFYSMLEYGMNYGGTELFAEDGTNNYGLTEDELEELMTRGYRMPLSNVEVMVADELKKQLSSPGGEEMNPEDLNIMMEMADEYGMRFGQVISIFVRMNSDLL